MYKNLRDKVKNSGNLPKHIAIIMDGNGRWAKRNLPRAAGHREGINSVREIVEYAVRLVFLIYPLYFLVKINSKKRSLCNHEIAFQQ